MKSKGPQWTHYLYDSQIPLMSDSSMLICNDIISLAASLVQQALEWVMRPEFFF